VHCPLPHAVTADAGGGFCGRKPKGDFMGLQADGTKSFKIMTVDIHTVVNGQVVQMYHVEDWSTAMKQLK
jgi:hypothetical protein